MKKNNIWSKSQVPLANYTFFGFSAFLVTYFLSLKSQTFADSSFMWFVGPVILIVTPILGSLVVWRYSSGVSFTDKLMSLVNKASVVVFFTTIICFFMKIFEGSSASGWSWFFLGYFVAFAFNLNPSPNERRTVVDAIALTLGQIVISFIMIILTLKFIKKLTGK